MRKKKLLTSSNFEIVEGKDKKNIRAKTNRITIKIIKSNKWMKHFKKINIKAVIQDVFKPITNNED